MYIYKTKIPTIQQKFQKQYNLLMVIQNYDFELLGECQL